MSNDIYSRRSRKRNRKISNQQNGEKKNKTVIYISAAVAIVIVGLFFTRNIWVKELEKIGLYSVRADDFEINSDGVVINSGITSEENFPIMLSDSSDYQTGIMARNLVVLSDTDFSIYSPFGELVESRSHDYSNVILKCENERSLIYESGGKKFRVETNKKTVFEKNIEDSIIFARISRDGYIALVSTSDAYACMLTIYDPKGNMVYCRGSISRIIEVCFNNESTGCRVSIMDANSGRIVSTVYGFYFRNVDSRGYAVHAAAAGLDPQMLYTDSAYYYDETVGIMQNAEESVFEEFGDASETELQPIIPDEAADIFTNEPVQTEDIFSLDGNNNDKDETNDIVWRTNLLDTLCISLNSTFGNNMIIIGDNQYGYYDSEGKYLGGFNYKNSLIAGRCYDDKLVMIFSDVERRKSSVIIVPGSEENPIEKISDDNMKAVCCEEKFAYVMTEREILAYDYQGNISAKAPVSNIYKSFLKSGNTVFLIGNSRIDKINFTSNQ